ncbi:MAG: YlbF family regulator [Bacilli bacterium]|nr:YlbF family regulator [Bacilli bacterium]
MNDITKKIDILFDELEKTDTYKDYISVKNQLENNKDIKKIIEDIKRYQKIVVNNKDKSVENKLKELYKKLDDYPIYQSYLDKKEDLEYELKMISDTFSSYFEKLLKLN